MAVTPNYGWPVPVATDYVKDGWEAISDLGNAIDTTVAGLGSGLTLVTESNPSASTGVSFGNLVVGKRYRILASLLTSSAGNVINIRFRENTTDKTTGYYAGGYSVNYLANTSTYSLNNAGQIDFADFNNTFQSAISIDLFIPAASYGLINVQLLNINGGRAYFYGGYNVSLSNLNGFTIYPSSGTMTGKISLYEYE